MKKYTLNKKERLKSYKEIQLLFKEAKVLQVYPLKMFYSWDQESEEKKLLFSVSVSKRNFKKSPDRNRIKRIIRECYRLQNQSLKAKVQKQGKLNMMIVFQGKEMAEFKNILDKVGTMLKKLENSLDLTNT